MRMESNSNQANQEEQRLQWMTKSGYLSLKVKGPSVTMSSWFNKKGKRYWFVLHEANHKLLYFSTRSDSFACTNPCGTIDFSTGETWLEDNKDNSFMLRIASKEYTLIADEKNEKKVWIEKLHECIPELNCTLSPDVFNKYKRSASMKEKLFQQKRRIQGQKSTDNEIQEEVPRAKNSELRRSRSITYPGLNFPDSDMDDMPKTRNESSSSSNKTKVKTKWFIEQTPPAASSITPTLTTPASSQVPQHTYSPNQAQSVEPVLRTTDDTTCAISGEPPLGDSSYPDLSHIPPALNLKDGTPSIPSFHNPDLGTNPSPMYSSFGGTATQKCPLSSEGNSVDANWDSDDNSHHLSHSGSDSAGSLPGHDGGDAAAYPGAKVSDYVAIDPQYLASVMSKANPGVATEKNISPESVTTFEDLQNLIDQKKMDYSAIEDKQRIHVLESEVNRLKCEVLSLIEGSMKFFVPDDEFGDWHVVEEVQHKDRIVELLMDAREENPSLPQCTSKHASSFIDKYGFMHGSREQDSEFYHFICRELIHHYGRKFKHRDPDTQLWTEYLRMVSSPGEKIQFNTKELQRLTRKGIPCQYRQIIWKLKCREKVQHIIDAKGNGYYQQLCEKLKENENMPYSEMSETAKLIRLDLLRTMPTNVRFKHLDSDGIAQLSRVMNAFSILHNPTNGYLQGMNFIVALFLLFMEEEDAFWGLVAIVEVYLKDYFDDILSGCQADQELFKEILKDELPSLDAHLRFYEVDISAVTFSWFITIFIDATPLETLLRIWDCFLFEGVQVLFRIGLAVLKINQSTLLHLSGHLNIIQCIKKVLQVTYDADYLMKIAWDDLKTFPPAEYIADRHTHHLQTIFAQHKERVKLKVERRQSRVSSVIIDVSSEDKNAHLLVLECAAVSFPGDLCEATSVWLCCSSRDSYSQLSILDVAAKEMFSLDEQIKSRILCCLAIPEHIVLVGTLAWNLHAFSTIHRSELWRVQLSDAIISLSYDHIQGNVYACLADGRIAVVQFVDPKVCVPPSDNMPFYIHVGKAPVTCSNLVEQNLWCGCGNSIVILDTCSSQFSEIHSFEVSSSAHHMVSNLVLSTHGIWSSVRGSCFVFLWDIKTHNCLVKMNVLEPNNNTDTEFEQVNFFNIFRITALLSYENQLWVGLANGTVCICNVLCTSSDGEDKRNVKLEVLQHYRISEDSIRCLLPLRFDETKVLSCSGRMGVDGCLALWTKGDSKNPLLWYPRLIKCRESEEKRASIDILSRSLTMEKTLSC